MIYSTTLTQKGQVTIPAEIRTLLNLKPYHKVTFEVSGTQVTIKKSIDFLTLKGSLAKPQNINNEKADRTVQNHIAHSYEKENR